jgi:hypothetical protein
VLAAIMAEEAEIAVGTDVKAHVPSYLDKAPWARPRLEKLSKAELIDIILDLQVDQHRRFQEKDRRIAHS